MKTYLLSRPKIKDIPMAMNTAPKKPEHALAWTIFRTSHPEVTDQEELKILWTQGKDGYRRQGRAAIKVLERQGYLLTAQG